jgi:hypothetical protein
MPNPRKPRPLKIVAGTDRPCRRYEPGVEFDPIATQPPMPDWLPNEHAVAEWNRLAPILTQTRLLTEVALSSLAHLCALHGVLVEKWRAGEPPSGHVLAQYRALAGEFGITPAAAMKVRANDDAKPANRFGAYGKRP